MSLGVMYAFGHGSIVLIVGLISIFIGVELPHTTRELLEVLVSLTLIILGGIILYSLLRQKKEYEYKSRLKIVYELMAKFMTKMKVEFKGKRLSSMQLGIAGAFVIGIVHGIGVESPTQVVLLTNAVDLNNLTAATMQLILFVLGLLISTVCITFCLTWGFLKAKLKRQLYFLLGSITGIYSLGLGVSMLLQFWKGGV